MYVPTVAQSTDKFLDFSLFRSEANYYFLRCHKTCQKCEKANQEPEVEAVKSIFLAHFSSRIGTPYRREK